MKNFGYWAMACALTLVSACDKVGDFGDERADSTYRAAMNDYQAGRLEQAIAGFKKACAANPANASARFQLACLLQDSVKDYLGAFCAYREYLLQCPDSEKAKLAADRLAACEREMAKELSEKYASGATLEASRQLQKTKSALSRAETEVEKMRVSLDAANRQLAALRDENDRLKKFMRDEIESDVSTFPKEELETARSIVEPDDASPSVTDEEIAQARRLKEDDDPESSVLIERETKTSVKPAASHPDSYVVQEGDTLYKIAVKFYGRASVWQRIRAANRATISTDGRLRAGQKIILPNID